MHDRGPAEVDGQASTVAGHGHRYDAASPRTAPSKGSQTIGRRMR